MKRTYILKRSLLTHALNIFHIGKINLKIVLVCICLITFFKTEAQIFNVTSYGAIGNGTTDDKTAILNTIKAANTWSFSHSNAQATVYFPFPSVCYLIKDTLADNNPTNRPRNYVFPIYSNLKYLGAWSGGITSTIKFDSGLFSATSGGDSTLGTGIYANANMFYGYRDTNNAVVHNVVFSKLTIDFNGANNLLPPFQRPAPNDPYDGSGKVKTIYGILFDNGCHDVIVDSMTFKNNPGLNDIVFEAAGQNLAVTNSKFINGGWNIGSSTVQNSNSADFSFIYSEWDNATFINDSIVQQYPEISLQRGSFTGGIEIHGSNNVAKNNYIFGCKPAIYVGSANGLSFDFNIDNVPMQNVQISNNKMLDCYRGIILFAKNYINDVRIDSNTISTMYLKSTAAFSQLPDSPNIIEGILIPKGNLLCRSDYEYNSATPFGNINLNPINNLKIRNNNISFDAVNSISPPSNTWTAGMRLNSLHNSQVSNDTIKNMNWAGIALEATPWLMSDLSINNNYISDFRLLQKTGPTAGYVLVLDNYLPNSDCNPLHQQSFNNINITGNSFNGNSTVSTEAACSPPYACFKGIYFALPNWYAYTSTPAYPYNINILKSSAFTISNTYSGYNPGEFFITSPCTSSNACFNTAAAPTDIKWFDILSDNNNTIEQEVDEATTGGNIGYCKSTYTSRCNIGYRLLGVGNPDITWTVSYSDNSTSFGSTKYGSAIILTRGVDYPLVNNSTGVLTVVATTTGGSRSETRYSSSCLDAGCSILCNFNVIISGIYSNAITESSTYIKSSSQTTINNMTSVKLDADPTASGGNVEFIPSSTSDFFLAAPANEIAVFSAQALDGCGPKVVSKSTTTTQLTEAIIGIFPNPSNGLFTISVGDDLQNMHIDVFDVNGRLQNVKILNINNSQAKIVANNLSKGIYLVKIYNKSKTEIRKIVIL